MGELISMTRYAYGCSHVMQIRMAQEEISRCLPLERVHRLNLPAFIAPQGLYFAKKPFSHDLKMITIMCH